MYAIQRGNKKLLVGEHDGKCHKKPFTSAAKARKFAKRISGRHKITERVARYVYRCFYCGYWHLSRKTEAECERHQ